MKEGDQPILPGLEEGFSYYQPGFHGENFAAEQQEMPSEEGQGEFEETTSPRQTSYLETELLITGENPVSNDLKKENP